MQAAPACVLCDKAVYHHLKDCPKVLAGSVRYVGVMLRGYMLIPRVALQDKFDCWKGNLIRIQYRR